VAGGLDFRALGFGEEFGGPVELYQLA